MINEYILLAKGKTIGFIVRYRNVRLVSVFCFAVALLIGCGEPNLDDPKVREQILAKAIDEDNLQIRRAPSGEDLYYAPNQKNPYTGRVKGVRKLAEIQNGKLHGNYISWYRNQQISEKGTNVNGMKDGLWTQWHENGQKSIEGTYTSGSKDGLWTEWYTNGQKSIEGTYINGSEDGSWTYWNKNGEKVEINYPDMSIMPANLDDPRVREKLLAKSVEKNNLQNSGWVKSSGSVHSARLTKYYKGLTRFEQGKKHGPSLTWFEDGLKDEEGSYKDNKKDGLWTIWYLNGQKQSEGAYKDDKKDSLWTAWYSNGQKQWKATYREGKRDGLSTTWYENGGKSSEGSYKDGKKDGLWTEWHENNRKQSEGSYKDDKKDGLWTTWRFNGQKRWEEIYKDGFRQ